MNKKKGRPSLSYNEEELYKIVLHYREHVKPVGHMSYAEIYRYNIELHESNPELCSKTFKEDFWKRDGQPGRKVVDTANAIRTVKIVAENQEEKIIPNLLDVIERYTNNKEKLYSHLEPIVVELRKSSEKNVILRNKVDDLKRGLIKEQEEKRRLRDQISLLEDALAKLFYYSEKNGTPLENLLDINNSNKRIKRALEEAFKDNNIHDFYFKISSLITADDEETEKIIHLDKKKKSLAEEFKDKF